MAGAACVILARGGSKGVPGKNLRRLGGLSLVARAVRAGLAARGVAGVWVSTDDAAIAHEARAHGAHVIDRPAELAGDAASSESGWLHALEVLGAAAPERLVFLQCTSPFTTGADIDRCLAAMAGQGADCALSVVASHAFLWGEGPDGAHGINHDARGPRARRQDLPPQWAENGAIYCVERAAFERAGRRFCGRVALCPVDHPGVEIDSEADLALCARLLGDRHAPEPALLRAVRAVVTDFDGVHTDDAVLVDQDGREAVRCARGDGLGLERLRRATGLPLLIASKERNPVVGARAAKLRVEALQGVEDKVAATDAWLEARGLGWADALYVGNDVNDLAAMARAGLAACPSDAHPSVLAAADWVLPRPGGNGALRVMADALVAAREGA